MSKKVKHFQCNVNMRQDVRDLIEGECLIRKNGSRGFSLTVNQIILEYFEDRTPENVAIKAVDGKPVLTIDFDPARERRERRKYGEQKPDIQLHDRRKME
jgi:hypothetical protein